MQDLNNDNDWEVPCSPFNKAAPTRTWYSGTHIFYVEVYDNTGTLTRGQVMIEIIPFSMERNLLWVDDYYAVDPQSNLYETAQFQGAGDQGYRQIQEYNLDVFLEL